MRNLRSLAVTAGTSLSLLLDSVGAIAADQSNLKAAKLNVNSRLTAA